MPKTISSAKEAVRVPFWLIESASPEALAIWCRTYIHQDSRNGQPIYRLNLASSAGYTYVESIDRYIEELVYLGALAVSGDEIACSLASLEWTK